jgi:hypothetical protein
MEIATYLGILNAGLAQGLESDDDKETKDLNDKIRQACCEAQMAMYELAKQEMLKGCE